MTRVYKGWFDLRKGVGRSRGSGKQAGYCRHAAAVREHARRQRSLGDLKMIAEQALQDRTQIGRGPQIPAFVEIGLFETRPVGDHAPTLESPSEEHGDRRGAVVGAVIAVDSS